MTTDRAAVSKMSGPELVATYTQLTGKPVARFASRADGVRRVLHALDLRQEPAEQPAPPAAAAEPATAPAAPTKAEKPRKAAKPRERRALALAGSADGKAARPGSKRAALVEALRSPDGISADEAMKRFKWTRRDVMDALRLAAKKNGVAVQERDGRYYADSVAAPEPIKLAERAPTKPERMAACRPPKQPRGSKRKA